MDGLQRVRGVELRHAARIMADLHRLGVALRPQIKLKRAKAVIHGLVQEGIDDGRGAAGILALAARDLMRQQHGHRTQQMRRVFLEENLPHAQLMHGIDDAVGEHDHQSLGTAIDQFTNAGADIILVERPEDLAEIVDTLANFPNHRDRHDRIGPFGVRDIRLLLQGEPLAVAPTSGQRNGVLEPGCDKQADARPLALDQRIGPKRGRISHGIDA